MEKVKDKILKLYEVDDFPGITSIGDSIFSGKGVNVEDFADIVSLNIFAESYLKSNRLYDAILILNAIILHFRKNKAPLDENSIEYSYLMILNAYQQLGLFFQTYFYLVEYNFVFKNNNNFPITTVRMGLIFFKKAKRFITYYLPNILFFFILFLFWRGGNPRSMEIIILSSVFCIYVYLIFRNQKILKKMAIRFLKCYYLAKIHLLVLFSRYKSSIIIRFK